MRFYPSYCKDALYLPEADAQAHERQSSGFPHVRCHLGAEITEDELLPMAGLALPLPPQTTDSMKSPPCTIICYLIPVSSATRLENTPQTFGSPKPHPESAQQERAATGAQQSEEGGEKKMA